MPLKVGSGSSELCLDVCPDCYNAFEQDNPCGPGGPLKPDGFSRNCKHYRFCFNARCDPHKHVPPSARQAIIAQIWKDIVKGDSAFQEAGHIFTKKGIAAILDENQYGLRATLAGHLHKNLQTRHVYNSIWNILQGTMQAREKLGENMFNVVSRSLDFCRVVYSSKYTKLVILILYVCQDWPRTSI